MAGTRPTDTFYVKYTFVFHAQILADVWRIIPNMQICNHILNRFMAIRVVRRVILSLASVNVVILFNVIKGKNFILTMSGVVYYESKKQLQDCICH